MPSAKTVTLVTLGCSKNLVDSEKLLFQFAAKGYRVLHDTDPPKGSIVIVNTCGFIGDAKEESINTILGFARLRRKGLISRLFVMGCLSQRYLTELQDELPEVDAFYGKFNFEDILMVLGEEKAPTACLDRLLTTPSHYAFLKISEGCSRGCSYCAIPIITGRHVSRPMNELVEEAKLLVGKGVKEIQLIAQDLSYYGRDLYRRPKLSELVERLADIEGIEWIRLHYTYPADFPMDVLRVMRERPNVCKYLDMALQHISDPMLKRMRRRITKAETLDLLATIRAEVPGIHLRTTLMVGHPGETEADFQELLDFTTQQRFERMGAFMYSEEEGTFAARRYTDNVPVAVKQARLDALMLLQQDISTSINQTKIGSTFKTVIDRVEGDQLIGRTAYDSPDVDPELYISGAKGHKPGDFCHVRITDVGPYDLYGHLDDTILST
ncbi:MAG: Ribosomal protein S12 methylthiotransferase RimO [Bacteroidetes bacterium ADurb.Bin416]|jgi:ribosomal protein S12 methylthiotransferase|nr:MAG: Ribosomal protein S12 methylthiotransferase RimO [Bacteroidetes bacterium ADurb.Bin416]